MRAGYQGRHAREAHAAARSAAAAAAPAAAGRVVPRVYRGMVERRVWAHAVRGEMPVHGTQTERPSREEAGHT